MKKIILFLSLSLATIHASNALADQEQANSVYNDAVSLLNSGKQMESLRGSTDVDENLQCNETMKSNLQKAQSLESAANNLATAHYQLKLAAIELHACTSCATDAIESFNRADEALNGFKNNS